MRKKGMGKAAAVIAAAMLFSLFSDTLQPVQSVWKTSGMTTVLQSESTTQLLLQADADRLNTACRVSLIIRKSRPRISAKSSGTAVTADKSIRSYVKKKKV